MRAKSLDCEFESSGTLYVFRDEADFEHSRWLPRALAEIDLTIETLDAARVHAMEPALKPGVVAGYFNPGDAHLRPDRYVDALARLVRAKGGVIEEGARIDAIEREGTRISRVRTSRGDFSGREVVLALGAWSPALAKQARTSTADPARQGLLDHVYAAGALSAHSARAEGARRLRHVVELRLSARQHDGICRLRHVAEPHAPRCAAARRGGVSARAGRTRSRRGMVRLAADDP